MRYFLPRLSTRIATSDATSVFHPIVEVLDHFVLERDDPALVLPPVVAVIVVRRERGDADLRRIPEHAAQRPAQPARAEDLGRHDHAARTSARGPVTQRARLFKRIGQVLAERLDRAGRDAELEQDPAILLDM